MNKNVPNLDCGERRRGFCAPSMIGIRLAIAIRRAGSLRIRILRSIAMKTDKQLQHDVIDELEWEPSIDASKMGVTAKEGVITLTGNVSRYSEKMEAEKLAKSIAGVKAVADDIEVRLPGASERNDTEIASAAHSSARRKISMRRVCCETRMYSSSDGSVR